MPSAEESNSLKLAPNDINRTVVLKPPASVNAAMPGFAFLGFALLIAWEDSCFFGTSLLSSLGDATVGINYFYWIIGLMHGIALIAIALFAPRIAKTRSHALPLFATAFATSAGTALIAISALIAAPLPLLWSGALLAGVGSAYTVILWGTALSSIDFSKAVLYILTSYLFGTALFLLCTFIPSGPANVIAVALLPILSAFLLNRCPRESVNMKKAGSDSDGRFLRYIWRLALGVTIFGISLGFTRVVGTTDLSYYAAAGRLAFTSNLVLLAAVLLMATLLHRTFDIVSMYRLVMPLMVAGLLLLLAGTGTSWIAYATAVVGHTCVNIVLLMALVDSTTRTGILPERSFGWGFAASSLSVALGGIFSGFVAGTLSPNQTRITVMALGIAYFLVVAFTFFLNDCKIFGEDAPVQGVSDTIPTNSDIARHRCILAAERYALTNRELEVLTMVAHGRSIPKIANELCISQSTVKVHVTHIYRKFNVVSRQAALDLVETIDSL